MVSKAGPSEAADPEATIDPSDEESAFSARTRELSAFNEWLKAGLALHRLGACMGVNEALLIAAKDQHIQLLNKARESQKTDLECTCKLATYDPAASCETCKTIARVLTDEHGAAPETPPLAWVNSNSRLWLHPEAGPLEISKLYAGTSGPSFVPRSIANIQDMSVRAKLSILASAPYLRSEAERKVVAATLAGLDKWAEDTTLSMSEDDVEQGQMLIQGVLIALYAALGSEEGRERLQDTLNTCGIIAACPSVPSSYGPPVVEAVLGMVVRRHCLRMMEGEEGVLEAEEALMAMDKRVRHCAPKLQGIVKSARQRVEEELKVQQEAYQSLVIRMEGNGREEKGEEEEDGEEYGARVMADLEARFHTGIREEVKVKLDGVRQALDGKDHKEALRLGMTMLLQGKDLQPGELHVLHEYLSWAYRGQDRLPQALASINKAIAMGGEDGYCALALRIKWRLLERMEEDSEDPAHQQACMNEALETIELIKDEDRSPSDQSRWAALNVNLSFHQLRALRRVAQTATAPSESGELPKRSKLCLDGVKRLNRLTAAFQQGKPSVVEQPFLYVSVQRSLGMFLADPAMELIFPDHVDRAIQCYEAVIHTVAYYRFVQGRIAQETEQLANYRMELAKLHLQRADETQKDETAALDLFEAAFETASGPGETINICRYRAELLERRGERLNSEGDLRGAIQDYQRALEEMEKYPKLKAQHPTEIAHFNRSLGFLYGTVVNVLKRAHGIEEEDMDKAPVQGEEGGQEWGPDEEQAIKYLLAAHDGFRRIEDTAADAGAAALQLGRIYRTRVKDRRKKNVEKAIEWFLKADSLLKKGGGEGDLASQQGMAEWAVMLCASLAALYLERTSGEKKDNRKRAEQWATRGAAEQRRLESIQAAMEREEAT